MDDDGNRAAKRHSYKLWYVVLAIAAVFVVVLGLCFVFHTDGVEKRLAALREAGQPTSFAELAEYTSLPDDAENAAGAYIDAFSAYVRPADDVNLPIIRSKTELPDRGEPLPEPMAEAMSKYLQDNRKCLALLREAGEIEYCRYQWNYATGFPPYLKETIESVKLLKTASVFYAAKGDANVSIDFLEDGLKLGNSLIHEPMLIGYILRIACIEISISGLERILNATSLKDVQMRQLEKMLCQTSETLDLSKAIITERCQVIENFTNPSQSPQTAGNAELIKTWFGKTGLIDYLDYMDECIEASKLHGTKRITRFQEIYDKKQNLSFLHFLVKMVAPEMKHFSQRDLRVKSQLDLAITALAVERYRLAKGNLPQRLEQLVPQYLTQIPTNPFNDNPIRYKQTNPGYILYSVGEDGEDDGGKERDKKRQDEPYDLTFIVTR